MLLCNKKLAELVKSIAICLVAIVTFAAVACSSGCEVKTSNTIVKLSQTSAIIETGDALALTATVSDDSPIIWSSNKESVASVNEHGIVTGVSAGTAKITAAAGDGFAVCNVTVVRAVQEYDVFLPQTNIQLKAGDTFNLAVLAYEGAQIDWLSSVPAVATVENGNVTGISEGVAVITAFAGLASANCTVNVVEDGETVALTLSEYSRSVKIGEGLSLSALASDLSSITWVSSDESVATVSGGTVSGVNIGTTTIHGWTAKASVSCILRVREVSDTYKDGYSLVWSDEFSGTALDESKWGYMTGVQDEYGRDKGPMYWGNNELQYYTEDSVTVSDGALSITATRRNMDYNRTFTSGRIHTRDKGHWTYGYFEARMQTPALNGMWPAFWMLPQPLNSDSTQSEYGTWAASGEIDIMEAKGRLKNYVDTTLHYGNYGYSTYKTKTTVISSSTEDWHIYALEWNEDHMSWYIDGIQVFRVASSEWWSQAAPESKTAPFDVDFYILLDLAVGGNYDGGREPDGDFISASMYVDYVRVYKAN